MIYILHLSTRALASDRRDEMNCGKLRDHFTNQHYIWSETMRIDVHPMQSMSVHTITQTDKNSVNRSAGLMCQKATARIQRNNSGKRNGRSNKFHSAEQKCHYMYIFCSCKHAINWLSIRRLVRVHIQIVYIIYVYIDIYYSHAIVGR